MPKLKRIISKFALIFSMLSFISLNLICSYALEIPSETILDGGFDILPDGNGKFFVLSYDQNNTKTALAYIDNTGDTPSIKQFNFFINNSTTASLDYKYTTANYCNNFIYLTHIKSTDTTEDTTIKCYQIGLKQSLCVLITSLPLNETNIGSPKQIAVANNENLFILESISTTSVAVYNTGGLINNIGLTKDEQTFDTIATDISKNYLYALDNLNNMFRYKINSNTYKLETPSPEINTSSFKFLTDSIFVNSDGYICTLNNSDFKLDSKVKIAAELKNYPVCVTSGFDESSILAKTDDKIISRIRCSDGVVTGKIELNENILALSTSGGKIIAVTGSNLPQNITLIDEANAIEITPSEPETPDENGGTQDGGNGNQDDKKDNETGGNDSDKGDPEENPSDETDDDSITSDIHQIDLENHMISEIPAGTTFAEFKNNLIFNGYSLVFKDANGNVKTGNSTKIGTGYTVTFVKDGTEKESFKLIVQGDVTGTGTLTSRDVSAFVNYLLGKTSLDDLYLQAADLNGDGEPDVIDLFAMYKRLQR